MDYEKKLREYIESVMSNPIYQPECKEWAFGAAGFAYDAGLISLHVRNMIQTEYSLLET